MIYEDSRNKSFAPPTTSTTSQKPKPTTRKDNSITRASISEESAYKYVSGVRKPIGIRVDTGLYSTFKPVAKRIYGSVCHALEIYMSALILTAENPASICNTSGNPINIEKIVIDRKLRRRRKLEFEDGEEVEAEVSPTCGFCGKPLVVARFRHMKSGREMQACDYHAEYLRNRSDWKEIP